MPRTSQWSSIKISKITNFALLSLWNSNQGSNHLSFALREVKHTCLTHIQHIDNPLGKLIFWHRLAPERLKTALVTYVPPLYIPCNWDIPWQIFYTLKRFGFRHNSSILLRDVQSFKPFRWVIDKGGRGLGQPMNFKMMQLTSQLNVTRCCSYNLLYMKTGQNMVLIILWGEL